MCSNQYQRTNNKRNSHDTMNTPYENSFAKPQETYKTTTLELDDYCACMVLVRFYTAG